jgi:xanthine/uracil permease
MKPVPPVITELLQRLFKKNPAFFKWVQYISAVIAVVAYLPELAHFLSIPLPSWFELVNTSTLKIGAITAIIMAQLPNEDLNPK